MKTAEAARAAHESGLCVIPPRENGTKAPAVDWTAYQKRLPTEAEVTKWWGPHTGLFVVCGAVSGNLEMLEWEDNDTFVDYCTRAKEWGISDLLQGVLDGYLEQAPGGGFHTFIRCSEISGNTKLASKPLGDNITKTLIETRGEGGGVVVAPSHGKVHPTGKPYVLLNGGFDSIVEVTPDDRQALYDLARSFDQMPKMERKPLPHQLKPFEGDRPGDLYNERVSWADVLEPHGWELVFTHGDEEYWRRPGKTIGVSATTNYQGSDLLKVFTTSTSFSANATYTKFAAYAVLNHGGDFALAGRELRNQGYTARPAPTSTYKAPTIIKGDLVLKRIDQVVEEQVEHMWFPYMPYGKITMVTGDPGIGKSELMLKVAAEHAQGDVLFISAEDAAADTIKPRYRKVGGDPTRLYVLDFVKQGEVERMLDLTRDIPLIEGALKLRNYDMVVLDPLNAFLPGLDAKSDNQVRSILGPIAKLAEVYDTCIVCLRHMNKSSAGQKAIYRGLNSIGYTGAARSELMVSLNPEDPNERLIHHIKANGYRHPRALAYTLFSDPDDPYGAPFFEWLGERDIDIEKTGTPDPEARTKLAEAIEFLQGLLSAGPVDRDTVENQAKRLDIKMSTVRRAKTQLGVEAVPEHTTYGTVRRWMWAMPQVIKPDDQDE